MFPFWAPATTLIIVPTGLLPLTALQGPVLSVCGALREKEWYASSPQLAGALPHLPRSEEDLQGRVTGILVGGAGMLPGMDIEMGGRHRGLTGKLCCAERQRIGGGGGGGRRLNSGLGALRCKAEAGVYAVSNGESPRYVLF